MLKEAMSEKEGPAVFDLNSNEVPLAQLWQSGPALLVFLRHYG